MLLALQLAVLLVYYASLQLVFLQVWAQGLQLVPPGAAGQGSHPRRQRSGILWGSYLCAGTKEGPYANGSAGFAVSPAPPKPFAWLLCARQSWLVQKAELWLAGYANC